MYLKTGRRGKHLIPTERMKHEDGKRIVRAGGASGFGIFTKYCYGEEIKADEAERYDM
jgi:hypothetical protein